MAKKKTSKKKAATNSNGNGHRDLLRELWNAAVALRGTIETPDYKRYVLPLIFLRFLSLRFEKRREDLDALIADPKSDCHTTDSKVRESILEDPDEYRAVGAFIVPKGARWSEIRDQAQEDDLKVRLDNILELLEKAYPDQLRGLLPRLYAESNMERDDLAGLVNLFSKDVFKQDHGGEDLIGKVYEYFIGEFASSEGKRGGEYFTPASIVRTLVAMLEPTDGIVFDPCCGSGGMFVQSDEFTKHSGRLSFVGQEAKEFTYRLCRMTGFRTAIARKPPVTIAPVKEHEPRIRSQIVFTLEHSIAAVPSVRKQSFPAKRTKKIELPRVRIGEHKIYIIKQLFPFITIPAIIHQWPFKTNPRIRMNA